MCCIIEEVMCEIDECYCDVLVLVVVYVDWYLVVVIVLRWMYCVVFLCVMSLED